MKKLLLILFFSVNFVSLSQLSNAQCAMCKQNAETSLKEGNTTASGLNAGILYMMVIPYALVGGIGYWWWKNYRKNQNEN